MGTSFMAFGLTMILRPGSVRANFDRFADYWKQGSWHPYKMPLGIALGWSGHDGGGDAIFLHRVRRVQALTGEKSPCHS
jgi:hypothetical protein